MAGTTFKELADSLARYADSIDLAANEHHSVCALMRMAGIHLFNNTRNTRLSQQDPPEWFRKPPFILVAERETESESSVRSVQAWAGYWWNSVLWLAKEWPAADIAISPQTALVSLQWDVWWVRSKLNSSDQPKCSPATVEDWRQIAQISKEVCLILDEVLDSRKDVQELWSPEAIIEVHKHSCTPFADKHTYRVWWQGESCKLGSTNSFRLIERLLKTPGICVSYQTLSDEVWGDPNTDHPAIHSALKLLKKKLCKAGMKPVADAISGKDSGHYSIDVPVLDDPAS